MPHEDEKREQVNRELDQRIATRGTAMLIGFIALAVAGDIGRRYLVESRSPVLRRVAVLAAVISDGAIGFGITMLIFVLAAGASITSRILISHGASSRTISAALVGGVLLLVAVSVIFLPFCLGSLREGTYDCIPLARRLITWLSR